LVNKLSNKQTFERSFSAVFGKNTQPSREDLDSFWVLINENGGKHVFHNLITYMSDRKRHRERWVTALQESVVPLGLINGSADPVSGAHMVERYREVVSPDHYVAEFPGIGHYPQVEAPDQTLDAYLRFLRQV
jgi:pimeloyl-ACP methyl ester carboxylesterase